ncbi:MAG: hypothetical protein LBH16_06975 [Treponema sp.]|jgi:hypothetical protein|nr:hypothetical protein [Treponema sp.]
MKPRLAGIFLILLFIISFPAEAQLYKPFASFRVIKTEHFNIIFPKESEASARLLASYADRVYDQISSLLGIEVPGRIPVTFAPHTDLFNAYYRSLPGSQIVLYDTAMDLEWTNFANNLESVFLHELTHAVSLNSRKPFFRFFHFIFGNWVSPANINAPLFMVEGVTISMESLSGFGRANDPLVKQKLRQAAHEDKFLTPFQASGVNDLPGNEGIWYEYGGLFSAWLINTYGMEKYSQLWKSLGGGLRFSFSVYKSRYYRSFRQIYGINFTDAWKLFKDTLTLGDLEENSNDILPRKMSFFSEKSMAIPALASRGNEVFILDSRENKVHVHGNEKMRSFSTSVLSPYDIDVSPDGKTTLVSGYHITGERARAVAAEQRTKTGSSTGRTIKGLYKARYFRDGVIGIRTELHNNCIVYETFDGKKEVLFRGNEELVFSGPQVLDDDRIVFIAARKGIRELLLYNYADGGLYRIENVSGGSEYWLYMRGLGVSGGKIFFSYNSDDRMYKLAMIDIETMQAVFNRRDISGGVFSPVEADGKIFYRGVFVSGEKLLRFPEESLSGALSEIKFADVDSVNYGLTLRNDIPHDAVSFLDARRNIVPAAKPYFGFRYMNPLDLWFPVPLIRLMETDETIKTRIDGGGFFTMMMDPAERFSLSALVYADIFYRMAMVDSLTWQTTVPGFPLTAEFSDKVLFNSANDPYRDTRAALSGSFSRSQKHLLLPGWLRYTVSLGGIYARFADFDGGESAYQWEETGSVFGIYTNLLLSSMRKRQNELFGTGLSLHVKGISVLDNFKPRVEGIFLASMETRFPVNVTVYGAYDGQGMNLHGVSRSYGQPVFADAASAEYLNPDNLRLTWIFGGEISAGIFSFEIQKNISHTYFNRFFGLLSLRNVLYEGNGNSDNGGIGINNLRLAQSLILKMGLISSFIPIKSTPFFIQPDIWGAWKFSSTITGEGAPFIYGIGFKINY